MNWTPPGTRRKRLTREQQDYIQNLLWRIQEAGEKKIVEAAKEPKRFERIFTRCEALKQKRDVINNKFNQQIDKLKEPIAAFRRERDQQVNTFRKEMQNEQKNLTETLLFGEPSKALEAVKALAKKFNVQLPS